MDPRELEKEAFENGDERKVAEMLGSLKRVEAPANFEFGVRARIAAGAPQTRSSLIPFVKLAAPIALVLLVGAFVLFYGSLHSAQDSTGPLVAEGPVAEIPQPIEPNLASPPTSIDEPVQRASGPNAIESEPSVER